VLIGGEGLGLPDALVASADERLTIPMQPPVESLNAAVTAALIAYEARRQRS
jgi:TrmH family RNA methyltransferase